MKKLVLIDGNSIAFRAFYALPLLTNSSGFYTNAVYGFAMMLLKILEEEKPTHLLVAFDAGKITFRHQEYKEYKGGRQKTPRELSEQFPLIKELLDAFQIKYYQLDQYEADDIIGAFAHDKLNDMKTFIVSGDKDLLQLVNKQVNLLLTRKGVTEVERFDIKAIDEKYGLIPKQIIELKGLVGDPSDNIPGIPGIGEKTALKMLHQFPTVEEIIQHIDELPGKKLQEKVREYQEQALLSKRLATIDVDVPLEIKLDDCIIPDIDPKRVADLFKKLGFKTLIERMQLNEKVDEPVREEISFMIYQEEHHRELIRLLKTEKLAIFVETTIHNPHHADVLGMVISDGHTHIFIDINHMEQCQELREWLADSKKFKLVYDLKKTKISLEYKAFTVSGIHFDILLAAYLLNPSDGQLELSDVVHTYADFLLPADDIIYGKGAKRRQLSEAELAEHLARKALALYKLYPILSKKLKEVEMQELMHQLEMPLSHVLAEMEKQGICVDQDRLAELGVELKKSMESLTEKIYELAGTPFNINSPKQLGEILFDRLGLPVLKKTKTGYSTSADVLEKLASQHEILSYILHFRQVCKLFNTYIEGLKKEFSPDGKVHTQFNQTITATGRLSSTEPNLQNIPIRLEEGRRIRQVFIPSVSDWFILSADYSQIELRVLAYLSEDENLQKAFKEGQDIHTHTAMDVFGVTKNEVTSHMRRMAKAVNFGIVYGISDYGLSQNLNISRPEAKEFIDRYFVTYPRVREYMDHVIKQARKEGYVTTLLHRRRYLADINAREFNRRSFAERTAMNTPIQGTAADIIKVAMVQLNKKMEEENVKSRLLLQVHDELIFEVPEEELSIMKKWVQERMEGAILLSVPLQVDINVGKNWYEAK